PDNFMRF
uniref:FMRFamide-17 n=4 Tax=Calyptratae TaxID=43742 RepID=FAR17_LUCCU|nr:RecName: Full=FMRFamide-like neuropeptide PDNFMRF-amide [Delia radicum]P41866.1 RecName: Full=CalliFMRFamide-11 [Calliphora vomitoria]P85461.1 RecName: Full=FMRFamide-17; AltName: Full=LucFMRFamide-17 [Lucilia cuprina]P85474.1 RecName: Full=SabFMRFamide-17 [Sarcophaga bullata]